MKKILIAVLSYFLIITVSLAKEKTDYSLKFNGHKYHLLYSVKNKDFGGYLNEYYRLGETYNIWTDMIAVHHFPNAYSPIDRIQEFKEYLSSMQCPSSLTFNDKKNTAMIPISKMVLTGPVPFAYQQRTARTGDSIVIPYHIII